MAIHMHSNLSSGGRSITEMAEVAKKNNIRVIIVTDLYHEKYEYGIKPFQSIFKRAVERNSIMKFGAKKYFEEIEKAGSIHPEVLVMDGTAVTPFYFWSGDIWKGPLVLNNRAKDFLVLGLGRPERYQNLPILGNGRSNFNAYEGDQFSAPYQEFIEKVPEDVLVFWSHPEANEHVEFKKIFGKTVFLDTPPYREALLSTHDYTGFGLMALELGEINNPVYSSAASTGDVWDKTLVEYCLGKRAKPVWVIGEVDYNGIPGGITDMDSILNMVFAPAIPEEILKALASGKLYLIAPSKNGARVVLNEFSVFDPPTAGKVSSGETLKISEPPVIHFSASMSGSEAQKFEIHLVRNGMIIQDWIRTTPFSIEFTDEEIPRGKSYYRIVAFTQDSPDRLLTNPIFVETR